MPWNVTFQLDDDKEAGEVGTATAEWTEPGDDEPVMRFVRRVGKTSLSSFVADAKRERAAVLRRRPKELAVANRIKNLLTAQAGVG